MQIQDTFVAINNQSPQNKPASPQHFKCLKTVDSQSLDGEGVGRSPEDLLFGKKK